GRHSGEVTVDITSIDRIKKMYEQVGKVDAIVSSTGSATFSPLTELTPEKNAGTISSKLGGQINLVLLGIYSLNDNGSIT
ncbi:short chain dehydrogenase, partial [Listeria monocytogenes]|nr:short chain dehydrogenase [Listeria monocytogenes]